MNTKQFFQALDLLVTEKGISKEIIIEALEHGLISAYRRNFNEEADVFVRLDEKSETMGIFAKKTVVGEVLDEATEMTLEEAQTYKEDANYGDVLEFEVTPDDFGRIATQTAKQVLRQRLRQAEQESVLTDFEGRIGELVIGYITKVDERNIYIDLGRAEGVLPVAETSGNEVLKSGERIKVYIRSVGVRGRNLNVMVTRRDPNMVQKLFQLEVPEIEEGIVSVVSVARDVGFRSKVCVASEDPNVDPIGACIGAGGSRIRNVISGLGGEKVDLIEFSDDPVTFISNALSPAKVKEVIINENDKTAAVAVEEDQLSLAIGKRGQNVRLAAQLTGWKIDIVIDEEMEKLRAEKLENPDVVVEPVVEEETLVVEEVAPVEEAPVVEEPAVAASEAAPADEIDEDFAAKLDALAALIDLEDE